MSPKSVRQQDRDNRFVDAAANNPQRSARTYISEYPRCMMDIEMRVLHLSEGARLAIDEPSFDILPLLFMSALSLLLDIMPKKLPDGHPR
jgi:hypothetical protein